MIAVRLLLGLAARIAIGLAVVAFMLLLVWFLTTYTSL